MPAYYKWLIGSCLLFTLVALPVITDAGCGENVWFLVYPACIILFAWWLWHTIRHFPDIITNWRGYWHWLSVPLAVLVLVFLMQTKLGLAYRVWLCERELTEFTEAVRRGEATMDYSCPRKWVGLFRVYQTDGSERKVVLITASGILDRYGIAYCPEGDPNGAGDDYQHLYGPWYRYLDDF
jgi:hypothetical protein